MPNYNTKDVFIQRRTQTGTFEEHPLVVQPNSLIVTDPLNNLIMVDTSSFLAGTGSITQAISSSYSNYAVTSSYALNVPATASLSASYSTTASYARTASYIPSAFSRGGSIYDPLGIAGTAAYSQSIVVWRAPFACTVTNVWGQRITGSGAYVNAFRTSGATSGSIAATNINLNTANTWISASSLNAASTSFSIGDELDIFLVSSSAYPTQIAIQVDFTK